MAEYALLERGKPYPGKLPLQEGAVAEFLKEGGSSLLIAMPGIKAAEEQEIRKNPVQAGIIVDGPLILWVFKFSDQMMFDAPFDARFYQREELQLHHIEDQDQRLSIGMTLVDSETKLIKGLRYFTLSPELTLAFLVAVQEQLADPRSIAPYLNKYLQMPVTQVAKLVSLQPCGQ